MEMEQRLNHKYLRPGPIARATAIGIIAAGIGAGVLLACWGLSFLRGKPTTVVDNAAELELLRNILDQLKHNRTEQADAGSGSRDNAVAREDPLIVRRDAPIMRTPATTVRGKPSFAATWEADADVDVYARCSPDLPYLSYSQPDSPEGHHVFDWRQSPGPQAHEIVEVTRDVDVRLCDFYLNLYAVHKPLPAPPGGKVRIEINGNVWESPFQFGPGASGNRAAGFSRVDGMAGRDWVHIDIPPEFWLAPALVPLPALCEDT